MAHPAPPTKPDNPKFTIVTSMGTMKGQLFRNEVPNTVENFVRYAKEGFYKGTIFHRVIEGFVIQGGGYETNGKQKKTHAPIKLEVTPKLVHWNGALSMARTPDPNSATSQFYVCHGPQHGLDQQYAVFGIVQDGLDVLDKIATVRTDRGDKPKQDVVIEDVQIEGA